jgi:hypothetical protein
MPVDYTHEQYDDRLPDWTRSRDFIAGEKAVKGKRQKYLKELIGQTTDEYDGYNERAKFLNATGRTHEGLVGMVFLKDPVFTLPSTVKAFEQDANLAGDGLYAYTRKVVNEVLAVGRGGTLVDWDEVSKRAYFAYYEAECIRNWRYEMVRGKKLLTMVVLSEKNVEHDDTVLTTGAKSDDDADPYEPTETDRIRVLRLLVKDDSARVIVEMWERAENAGDKKGGSEKWLLIETKDLTRAGKPLEEIPFVFHNPDLDSCEVAKPPLEDLISLNLFHFRLSADHAHGLHFVALPTPWVAGFDNKTELRIGSSVAWVTENENASAGFLEFSGAGLGAIKEELAATENSMAVLGARLLETQKRMAETAEAMSIRQSGESAVLTRISAAISTTLREALKWAHWWSSLGLADRNSITDKQLAFELNSDFTAIKMTGPDLVSFVSAWIQGGISFDTLFWNLKKGELIPPDRTMEQERELIEAEPPPSMDLDDHDEEDEKDDQSGS